YHQNLAKADQEMKAAGMKKVGGQWILPNGKPFTMTLDSVSGFNDWIEADSIISDELTKFGIQTKPVIVASYSQYLQELSDGKISAGFWIGSIGPNPYSTFARLYGADDGYNVVGGKLTYTPASKKDGGNWLDFPKTVQVKGYGMLNPGKITQQLSETSNQAVIKSTVQKLAFLTNQYVPAITLWNYVQAGFVNTKNFTDYPLKNQSLMIGTEGYYPPIGLWEMFGSTKPK
ncbi:MAG: hypothetical protein OWS74_06290, partial [Firmicutes bacterium]|nr:hypothetical protein [Bacillota bacterium]